MITDTVQQPGKITMLQIGIALFLGCFFFGSILSNFIWQDTAWMDWICRGYRLATDSGRWRTAGTLFWAGFNPAGDSLDYTADFPLHFLGTVGVRRLVWMAGGVRRYGDRCILEQKRTGRYRTGSGILFSADACL